ncbi:MAG: hypothetical protein LUE93_12900 [Bacteroides sp.]|nr:hypothetical protein [Bacteroides sp.]
MKTNVLNGLGHGYIRIPRTIAVGMLDTNLSVRHPNYLHFTLLALCNYTYAPVHFNGCTYPCKPGELVTSDRALARITGLSRFQVKRLLQSLSDEDWIEQWPIAGAKRIRLRHYEDITQNFIVSGHSPKIKSKKGSGGTGTPQEPGSGTPPPRIAKRRREAIRKIMERDKIVMKISVLNHKS